MRLPTALFAGSMMVLLGLAAGCGDSTGDSGSTSGDGGSTATGDGGSGPSDGGGGPGGQSGEGGGNASCQDTLTANPWASLNGESAFELHSDGTYVAIIFEENGSEICVSGTWTVEGDCATIVFEQTCPGGDTTDYDVELDADGNLVVGGRPYAPGADVSCTCT